jgi:hypothetical protein
MARPYEYCRGRRSNGFRRTGRNTHGDFAFQNITTQEVPACAYQDRSRLASLLRCPAGALAQQCDGVRTFLVAKSKILIYGLSTRMFRWKGKGMDQPNDEEAGWARKIDELRVDLGNLDLFLGRSREQSKVSWDDHNSILKAFTDVFRHAAPYSRVEHDGDKLTCPQPDDAVTYALYRNGLHQLRRKLVELHPELESEMTEQCPPVRGRRA